MGSMLNPGLGDRIDRLSILELKIRFYLGDRSAFIAEADRLRELIEEADAATSSAISTIRLIQVNTLLWALEDEGRAMARTDKPDSMLGSVFRKVQALNAERSRLIAEINGDEISDKGEEMR